MKREINLKMKMHFTTDAMLVLVLRNNQTGDTRSYVYPKCMTDVDNYFNSRKEMNQVPANYEWRVVLPAELGDWEIDLDSSRVEFGYLDRRSYRSWNEGSPIRTDFLRSLESKAE